MKKKGKKEARTGEGNAELKDNRRMRQWVRGSALKHRGPRLSLFLSLSLLSPAVMSRRSGSESVPILHQPGILGTIARFWQRTYAADYLALGVLWVTWFMVSASWQLQFGG